MKQALLLVVILLCSVAFGQQLLEDGARNHGDLFVRQEPRLCGHAYLAQRGLLPRFGRRFRPLRSTTPD
uniref:Uncharacterized protein n=1 Tax=Anopheles dirus TaxID=7168 RepID=A0A182NXK6_9DIPT